MYRALEILEIVEMICEQAAIMKGDWSGVATLARTCAFFLNPALNAIWRHQEMISNLLKCFPDNLWDIAEYYVNYRHTLDELVSIFNLLVSTPQHRLFRLGAPLILYAPC
jgi:hypothetical protein